MDKKNRLLENIFSMITLRGMEYILAFLLVPYLLRTLGPEQYGSIAFMQGIIAYFTLVINYGFNITAPKDIALAEPNQLSKIFSSYFWATVFLWIGCSIVFGIGYIILYAMFNYELDLPLFFACYMTAIGMVVFPIWFFQGIQQMRYITVLNLFGRFITIVMLFLFIRSPKDYVLAAFLQSCTTVFAGIISWLIIHKKWRNILDKPVKSDIIVAYKKGWQIFLSTLAVNLYTSSDIVILGIMTNPTIVGYYSGAEKLISCVRRGIGAVSDAIYPYISQKMKNARNEAYHFLRKQLLIYTVGGVFGGITIFFFAPCIIPWLLGDKYVPSINLIQIMAFVPLVVAISTVFGYETMLPLGMQKKYSQILIVASIFNLGLIVPSIIWQGAVGVAFCVFATETFITLLMGIYLWRKVIVYQK